MAGNHGTSWSFFPENKTLRCVRFLEVLCVHPQSRRCKPLYSGRDCLELIKDGALCSCCVRRRITRRHRGTRTNVFRSGCNIAGAIDDRRPRSNSSSVLRLEPGIRSNKSQCCVGRCRIDVFFSRSALLNYSTKSLRTLPCRSEVTPQEALDSFIA